MIIDTKKLSLLASALILSGCVPVIAAGVGTAVGVSAVQEGGLSEAGNDLAIQATINDLWFRYDTSMFMKLDLTINQGRVLITGVVQNPQHRVEAVRLAWQAKGVKQVINEIKVANSEGFVGYAKDTWISTRLRSAILLNGDIESLNYSIDTVQGSVYLMGFAQDQSELDRVIETARNIPNVKQVVSYVKLVGEPADAMAVSNNMGQQREQGAVQHNNNAVENYYNGGAGELSPNDMGQNPPAPVADGDPVDWNATQGSLYD